MDTRSRTSPRLPPKDLEAVFGSTAIKIEVNGTTSTSHEDIFMTKNETDLHLKEKGSTGIVVVCDIQLTRNDGEVTARGAQCTQKSDGIFPPGRWHAWHLRSVRT